MLNGNGCLYNLRILMNFSPRSAKKIRTLHSRLETTIPTQKKRKECIYKEDCKGHHLFSISVHYGPEKQLSHSNAMYNKNRIEHSGKRSKNSTSNMDI